jgi:L-threonylcarbamoyladenylate synthase
MPVDMRRWFLSRVARIIAQGGLVAYPTEAIYGIGCDPANEGAVKRLLALKQRSIDLGLILIASDMNQVLPFIAPPTEAIMQRIGDSWPGPTTWLLPKRPDTPVWLSGRHDTLAVRITRHPLAAALCRRCNHALVSTSANRHGQAPARTALKVRKYFDDALDLILCGTTDRDARPSEIRDAHDGRVIRSA